jgi:hypothetical protein
MANTDYTYLLTAVSFGDSHQFIDHHTLSYSHSEHPMMSSSNTSTMCQCVIGGGTAFVSESRSVPPPTPDDFLVRGLTTTRAGVEDNQMDGEI